MRTPSRRQFLKFGAMAAGSTLAARRLPGFGTPFTQSVAKSVKAAPSPRIAITPPLSQFAYSQVELLAGVFREQFDHNHQLFLNIDDDALLKPYRQRENLSAPGPDMGGWYDNSPDFNSANNSHGFATGHSFGQYLSGLARAYAVTGSKPTQEKVRRLVRGYAATIDPAGKFYVDYRFPAYTFDKVSCGLIDAHEFAQSPDALAAHWRATQAVLPHLPERALSRYEQRARGYKDVSFTWDESYTLPENFFLAYQRSGNARYRELGARYLEQNYFDPLSEDHNVLPFEHAYSHVNAFSSAMQAYLVLGDAKYLRAAKNGLRMVQEQSYATGGWGPGEAFLEPGRGGLAGSLDNTHANFETPCGAYAHFKVTRYLLRATRDSRYGDSMERVLYNTIGGARLIQSDGTSFYYSDYANSGAHKFWHNDKWPCCSGTFPQLTADYHISTYFSGKDGVYVNLFLPSRLTWTQGGTKCTMTQKTEYPCSNTIRIEMAMAAPQSFEVNVRVPQWAGPKTAISVNGKRADGEIAPGTFFAWRRAWQDGDRVEIEMDMPPRLEPIAAENPNIVAVMRGPIALFAIGDNPPTPTRDQLLAAQPLTDSSSDLLVQTTAEPVTFRSFMDIKDEMYRLYQTLQTS